MKTIPTIGIALGVAMLALAAGAAVAVVSPGKDATQAEATAAATARAGELIAVAPPPFSEGIFPCSECHVEGIDVDISRRELAFHDEIILEHDAENRWCLDCHDATNRDVLHLADGRPVEFTESYRLCGQCHGTQLRDWRAGDHGRRTGSWSGVKEYLLCAHCHNPHSPSIKPMAPLPPPLRQEAIR